MRGGGGHYVHTAHIHGILYRHLSSMLRIKKELLYLITAIFAKKNQNYNYFTFYMQLTFLKCDALKILELH